MSNEAAHIEQALTGRYRIKRELGRGGMATVYLADDIKHRREIALKVLDPDLAQSVGSERFLREIEISARLDHPHILPLLDSGNADGFLYYVMPYVEGESLRDQLVREKQLAVEDAIQVTREVADALTYAHSRGVIHRDIKPENILLARGHARVADFGIARAISVAGVEMLTATGLAVGTPVYMSPEQAGGSKDLDGRSDVYSLGCVLYEMLAGQPPFTGPTVESIVKQHLTATPPDITTIRPAVSGTVRAALSRALAKTPADRFATASGFAQALEVSYINGSTIGTRLPHRYWRLATGILSAVLLGVLALWAGSQQRRDPLPVVRSSLVSTEDLALGCTESLLPCRVSHGGLELSPDGSLLVYRAKVESGTQLFVRALSDLVDRPLSGTRGASSPFFSPDGRWIGFLQGQDLRKIAVDGGSPVEIVKGVPHIYGASWAPNGTIIFADGGSGLMRVRSDGSARPETITTEGQLRWPDVLPGGDAALVQMDDGGDEGTPRLAIVSLETGNIEPLDLHGTRPRYVDGYILFGEGVDRGTSFRYAQNGVVAAPFDVRRKRVTGPTITLGRGMEGLLGWTASGSALAYVLSHNTGTSSLAWISRDGEVSEVDSSWIGDFSGVALSPDGTQLAASMVQGGGEHIWVKSLPAGPPWKLTVHGGRNHRPSWTPDGRAVTFVSNRAIFTQRADGSQPAEVLLRDSLNLWEATWSRDSRWLIVRIDDADVLEDLVAIRFGEDSVPKRLFTTPVHQEWHPTLSPDARWIAYESDESGVREVYVRPFPRVLEGRWLVSRGGGTEPIWAHNGTEIFYRSAANQMMAAKVSTADTFAITRRDVLFDAAPFRLSGFDRTYGVDPRGERFLMIRPTSPRGAPREIILVQNFVDEMKSRSGSAASRSRRDAP
jgi:serine/threonine-protein kinase